MIRSGLERLIGWTAPGGDRTFFPSEEFAWVARVETAHTAILAELTRLLLRPSSIPNFQDVSADQKILTSGTDWKTFFLFAYGRQLVENCALCPKTVNALHDIPGMKTAMFSILAPGKHIPEHRGPYKGVLRYHLGLIVPKLADQCRIRVGHDYRHWAVGKSLVFDDSHPHEVWNQTDEMRAVLFVDFERPLPFPIASLNRAVIRRIADTDFVTTAVANITSFVPPDDRMGTS